MSIILPEPFTFSKGCCLKAADTAQCYAAVFLYKRLFSGNGRGKSAPLCIHKADVKWILQLKMDAFFRLSKYISGQITSCVSGPKKLSL